MGGSLRRRDGRRNSSIQPRRAASRLWSELWRPPSPTCSGKSLDKKRRRANEERTLRSRSLLCSFRRHFTVRISALCFILKFTGSTVRSFSGLVRCNLRELTRLPLEIHRQYCCNSAEFLWGREVTHWRFKYIQVRQLGL